MASQQKRQRIEEVDLDSSTSSDDGVLDEFWHSPGGLECDQLDNYDGYCSIVSSLSAIWFSYLDGSLDDNVVSADWKTERSTAFGAIKDLQKVKNWNSLFLFLGDLSNNAGINSPQTSKSLFDKFLKMGDFRQTTDPNYYWNRFIKYTYWDGVAVPNPFLGVPKF